MMPFICSDNYFDKQAALPAYTIWKKNPNKRTMSNVIREVDPIISRELTAYKGAINPIALKGMAKKIAIDAIKTYDPNKGASLGTHISRQMTRLHRKNYASANAIRLPENLQQGVGGFLRAKEHLEGTLGREPTAAEIADEMNWNIRQVTQLEKQVRNETSSGQLQFDPAHITESVFDSKIDFFYNDLSPQDKLLFEHTTGYGGKKLLSKKEIATKLNISAPRVSQLASQLANKLKRVLNG